MGSPYLEVREHLWLRPKKGDVGPFWSFLHGLYVYAYSEAAPNWMQISPKADEFEKMGHKALPILKVIGDADVYCFTSEGKIQRWMHEGDLFKPFDGTFFDLLEFEVKELDGRRKRKRSSTSRPNQPPRAAMAHLKPGTYMSTLFTGEKPGPLTPSADETPDHFAPIQVFRR